MQFVFDNGLYKVARITGPMHNFLAIRLATSTREEIKLTSLETKSNKPAGISGETVLAQVTSGLAHINAELGQKYAVSEVQFIASDTMSNSVYELLTTELIRKIHMGWEL